MILLKANSEIKTVFFKMIKTMGENVKWTEIFVINNNDIILAGNGRSLFFNFDNRRAFSNIVELPIKEDRVEQIIQNPLLENTLNMILYAFGKWGGIKGLKVEMNYDQLNKLINNILDEIDIESSLTKDNFRFYKDGVQITYEEVIQAILDKSKPEDEEDSEKETEESNNENNVDEIEKKQKDKNNEYEMGLWHNMRWTAGNFSFVKEELAEYDSVKFRIGKNFYKANYKCPACGEMLSMVVYPAGKEFRIETDEEAVYMSRAYTCRACNSFYTPKPYKLLMEGDIYNLTFEDDKVAYEDYLELLGSKGERTSNSNFNVFESEYNKNNQEIAPQLGEISSDLDSMSEIGILELKDKMDSGFYPQNIVEKYYKKVNRELKRRKHKKIKDNKKETNENWTPSTKSVKTSEGKHELTFTKRTETHNLQKSNSGKSEKESSIKTEHRQQNENESLSKEKQKQDGTKLDLSSTNFASKTFEGLKEILDAFSKGDHDFFVGAVEKLTPKQLDDLKLRIQSVQGIDVNEKTNYINIIDRVLYKEKEKELIRKAVSSKEKKYTEILQLINEIKEEDCADSIKKPILKSLMEMLKKNGEKELELLVNNIPDNVSRKQYNQFREKIEQYKEIDSSPHKKHLDEKRDTVEKQEIAIFIKRSNAIDRKSLFDLYRKLKELDFEERNVNFYLEKIYDKIYAMDEAAIKKICPDPVDITFDEGVQMYEEISSENFLPELKLNVLGIIDKRLMKMKMDECEQLVNKLSKDMEWTEEDYSRIYFYEVRKMMKGDSDNEESRIIHNALNTYAAERGKYEYPILICDASIFENGRGGFVLTPDHIFYNGLLNSGVMDIMDIEDIHFGTGLYGKGIYVNNKNTGKVKISNSLKSNKLKSFAKELNDFVSYLKEKPESRNISYMAKEKHTVKCCYRCGYVYKVGNVCPRCGGKFNE